MPRPTLRNNGAEVFEFKIALAILFQARDDARRGDAEAADFLTHSDLAADMMCLLRRADGLLGEIELGTFLRRAPRPRALTAPPIGIPSKLRRRL